MVIRAVCVFVAAFPVWAGSVHIDVRFTPASPSLSDVIRLDVALTGTDGVDVVLRPVDIPPDCVAVQSSSVERTRAIVILDPVKPGPCRIPAFRARCLHGATEGCDVQSAETVIPIGTMVTDRERADIRDQDETPVDFHPNATTNAESVAGVWWLAGAALLVIALGWAAFWIWRARRRDPVRRAAARLKKLSVPDSDPSDAFSQLTTIFRDYLDERLAFGARSCTSPEIIDALRRHSLSEGGTAIELREFLALCDRAKFAGAPDGAAEFSGAAEECLSLIQSLEFYIARRSRARA